MARLNHAGSTSLLRRELFPVGFAGEVMLLVLETWFVFSLRHDVRHENRITAVFRSALIEAYVRSGRSWFVALEDPITDPDFGTELGRNDLRFYPQNHRGQTIFFTLECKRLRVTTKSGFRDLAAEYVDKGVMRFVNNQYSAGLPCGGMIGYVMDNDTSKALESIIREIKTKGTSLRLRTKNGICIPSILLTRCKTSADTFHLRTDGMFELHHLLVGVTGK
jgi:hypothetical protein